MATTSPPRRLSLSLQSKVLALVLVPLLVVTTVLVVIDAWQDIQDNRHILEEKRELLIDSRRQSVSDIVQLATTAIGPIYESAGPNDAEAQQQAAEILRAMRFDGDNYLFAYELDGTNVVLPLSPDRQGTNLIDLQAPDGAYIIRDMIAVARAGGGFYEYPWEYPGTDRLEPKYSYVDLLEKWGWMIGTGAYVTDVDAAMATQEAMLAGNARRALLTSMSIGVSVFAIVATLAWFMARRTVLPIRRTSAAMRDIAEGRGDLTRRLTVESRDEIGDLATQFNAFVERMQITLRDVRGSALSVRSAADEIAQGSEELASRTEQSAANLQETSASMEEITSTVNHSADSAQQANQLVLSTAEVAREGENAMQRVERTMDDINGSATRISDIITMIDSIAFQTNILALNASVEAARAGEHGRGFAVVAQEVRTLASRSSEASREIRALIDTSVAHTQSGAELVRNAGRTMQEIVASVARVTDVIGEISAGAKEQSSGIGQVNTAVAEMDTMTQQNAAMVQQTSTAASDMRRHAQRLNDLIGQFVLGDDGAPSREALAAPPAASHGGMLASPGEATKTPSRRPVQETADAWEEF